MGTLLFPDLLGRKSKYIGRLQIDGYIQSDDYSCGYAAAVTILDFFGLTGNRKELWKDLEPCSEMGITTSSLLRAARARGLIMTRQPVHVKVLKAAFDQGYPVLACAPLPHQPADESHWQVAADINKNNEVLMLNQPSFSHPRKWLPIKELRRTSDEDACWVARPR